MAKRMIVCRQCGVEKEHFAKEMCRQCYSHAHYIKNRDTVIERSAARDKDNPEKRREYSRNYRKRHPERARMSARMSDKNNAEKRHAAQKRRYHKNPEKYRARSRKYNLARRTRVLQHYGGKCACCGENNIEFLAIDHINGGGNIERRTTGVRSGIGLTIWIEQSNYPPHLRVLCHNCNMALAFYGYCPHWADKKPPEGWQGIGSIA